MPATSERLHWPNNEPPPAGSAPAVRKTSAGAMWPWYLLLALMIAAVAAGAWWLGTAKEAAPPELPAEQSLPIPVTPSMPAAPDVAAPPQQPEVSTAATPQSPAARSGAQPVSRPAERRVAAAVPRAAQRKDKAAGRTVSPADEPVAAPPPTELAPIVAYNPRPYGGRVVQLGAFPSRAQAEANWQRITRRYPYLTTRPKMVNTVDVRGLGGGRPTRMYRLQLGTSSQAQSVVICQQLERAGHSCVVVY